MIQEDHVHLCYKTELCWGECHGGLEGTCLRGIPGMKPSPRFTDEVVAAHTKGKNTFLNSKDRDSIYSAQDCLDIPRKQGLSQVTGA